MLAKEIREKSVKELITLLDETSIEYFKLKMQLTTGQLPTHRQVRESRKSIMNDNHIDQLIKDGQIKKAEKRAIEILKKWK